STAASGSTAIQRGTASPAAAMSVQVISIQSRLGNVIWVSRSLAKRAGLSYCRGPQPKEQPMSLASMSRLALAACAVLAVATITPASAQTLDKVTFATNWVAEAEHGGFYQAGADGTYKKHGLDVTIMPGGPNANNRILLPVGKIDFYLSA